MENNPFNDTDEMSETPSCTRRQRRRRKQRESMNEEYKMGDISSSDTDDMRNKPSNTRGQRRRTKRKESNGEKYKMEHNPSNDTDEENSSSILESTDTSDMWSVSSLEDIQFVVNTATVEEINVKTALQGLAASNEKDEQVDREASGDSKAQSFPSDKVSPDDLPFTNKDNVPASIGSTNLDASTAKDCSNVGERSTIKQVQPSEEVIAMEECQGGHSCGKLFCKHTEELILMSGKYWKTVRLYPPNRWIKTHEKKRVIRYIPICPQVNLHSRLLLVL